MNRPAPVPDTPPAWHAQPADAVMVQWGTPADGLSEEEVTERRRRFGPNRLPQPRGRSALRRLLDQFQNVLIYVLLAAAVISFFLGEYVDAAVIIGVVVINAVIGFIQEGKAVQAMEAIRSMLSPQASVLRAGRRLTVPAEDLVPGDLVFLASGDKVPADLRLVHTKTLQIQEAALTGESVPVSKSIEPVAPEAPLGDRTPMAYSGTLVTYGQGLGVVVATGAATELGKISTLLSQVETMTTPLLDKMARFGRWLTLAILTLSAAAFAFGVLVRGFEATEMFMAAVGIAVAAIPEGLPAIMTITLAIGVTRMARRNAIIRRLPAIETLGAVTVICSDKTSTLTRNELTVQEVVTAEATYHVTGTGYSPEGAFLDAQGPIDPGQLPLLTELARVALLCNDASLVQEAGLWRVNGDPTDGALLTLAAKAGLDAELEQRERPRTDLIPFESEHRFMATLHHDHAGHGMIYLKGAPERVLEMCDRERRRDGDHPIDPEAWRRRIAELASRGQRVIAAAVKPAPPDKSELSFADVEQGLVLLGLYGLIDPPRPEAIKAVAACQSAGIRVKMITGDHAETARAIGTQFGLGGARGALTGPDLDALDDRALVAVAHDTDIFARTTPEHKLRLVQALQSAGAVVAMAGDGVNDAPALKRADIGIAMGQKGTEAAKEASAMVLADDNFASIAHAVEGGRTVYDNLRKALLFVLPTNGAQALIVMVAILLGQTLPITPPQILWVNLVTAVTLALALAFEPTEPDVMTRPPRRPDEPLLTPYMLWRILVVTLLLVPISFGLFLWHTGQGGSLSEARTLAVNVLVMGEIFYLWNARFILRPVFSLRDLFGNLWVLVSIALALLFQLAFTYVPALQSLFDTAPLPTAYWGLMALCGMAVFVLIELEKLVARRVIARRG